MDQVNIFCDTSFSLTSRKIKTHNNLHIDNIYSHSAKLLQAHWGAILYFL